MAVAAGADFAANVVIVVVVDRCSDQRCRSVQVSLPAEEVAWRR